MDENLIIDDDYVQTVGRLCKQRGEDLEEILSTYISILEEIAIEAIIEGETARALRGYIECVQLLKEQLSDISSNVKTVCDSFIIDFDAADEYLF